MDSRTCSRIKLSIELLVVMADSAVGFLSLMVIIGVRMLGLALMISLIRGTPCVILMDAIPAKWKVFSVIWVAGSPMLCADMAPTGSPGSMIDLFSLSRKYLR